MNEQITNIFALLRAAWPVGYMEGDELVLPPSSVLALSSTRSELLEAIAHWCFNNPQTDDARVLAITERVLENGFLITPEEEHHLLKVFLETYGR